MTTAEIRGGSAGARSNTTLSLPNWNDQEMFGASVPTRPVTTEWFQVNDGDPDDEHWIELACHKLAHLPSTHRIQIIRRRAGSTASPPLPPSTITCIEVAKAYETLQSSDYALATKEALIDVFQGGMDAITHVWDFLFVPPTHFLSHTHPRTHSMDTIASEILKLSNRLWFNASNETDFAVLCIKNSNKDTELSVIYNRFRDTMRAGMMTLYALCSRMDIGIAEEIDARRVMIIDICRRSRIFPDERCLVNAIDVGKTKVIERTVRKLRSGDFRFSVGKPKRVIRGVGSLTVQERHAAVGAVAFDIPSHSHAALPRRFDDDNDPSSSPTPTQQWWWGSFCIIV
jgi:hypothetical protein